MLVLAIGDIFIPERACDFPSEFKKLLLPGKIQQVLCLGNSTTSSTTRKFLQSLSPDFQEVKGAFDNDAKIPISHIVKHDDLKIGVLSGITIVPKNDPLSLLNEARKMDVDILIWGGTHRVEAYTLDDKLFVNPGSATGAFTTEELDDEEEEEEEEEENEAEDAQAADSEVNAELQGKSGSVEEPSSESSKHGSSGGDKQDEVGDKVEPEDASEEPEAKETTDESEKEGAQSDANQTESGAAAGNSLKDDGESESVQLQAEIEKLKKEVLTTDEDDSLDDPIPSFCLLDIQGSVCTLYIYTYIDEDIKVDKVTYRK